MLRRWSRLHGGQVHTQTPFSTPRVHVSLASPVAWAPTTDVPHVPQTSGVPASGSSRSATSIRMSLEVPPWRPS